MNPPDGSSKNFWSRRGKLGKAMIIVVGCLIVLTALGSVLPSPDKGAADSERAASQSQATETSAATETPAEEDTSTPEPTPTETPEPAPEPTREPEPTPAQPS